MNQSILLLTSVAVLSVVQVADATSLPCTPFEEVMSRAASADPSVEVNRFEEAAAKAELDEAWSLWRPQVSAFAESGLGDVGVTGGTVQNQAGLQVSQRLFDFGDARLARREARFSTAASGYDVQQAEIAAATETALSYLQLLEVAEAAAATNERTAYFQRQLAVIEELLIEAGATRSERAEVAGQLANAKAFEADLERQQIIAETELEIRLGERITVCRADTVDRYLDERVLSLVNVETAAITALQNNPQLRAATERASAAAVASRRENRSRWPVVDLVGITAYSSGVTDDQFEPEQRVGVDVSIPLYTGDGLSARQRRVRAEGAAARSDTAVLRRQLETQVRISYRTISVLREQAIARLAAQESAREQFETTQMEYEIGTKTLPELIDARLDFETAALAEIATRYELARERLSLLGTTGLLISER